MEERASAYLKPKEGPRGCRMGDFNNVRLKGRIDGSRCSSRQSASMQESIDAIAASERSAAAVSVIAHHPVVLIRQRNVGRASVLYHVCTVKHISKKNNEAPYHFDRSNI
jgi:hypothetical protein